ncbi:hypothetical protein B0J18DRAFT_25940 [Chaetomium sp. MPI-SDFR-AT-0129]|nr:hypothetical protein B0J18DRAFT_25940 [Chaetomium sp. MPI-SDFR-AT-0129]
MGAQGLVATGVPPQPLWLLYIKIAILVLSLIVLALAAYSLSLFPVGAGGFDIFIAIWSWLIYGTAGALELWAPQYFFRIGALIGYILSIIFWLSAWAWSASSAAVWMAYGTGSIYSYDSKVGGALAGAAALGAVAWILNIVHLLFFIRASVSDDAGSGSGQAELGQIKPEGGPVPQQQQFQQVPPQQQQYQQPQQPYPDQQYQQPQPGYPVEQQQYQQQPYQQQPVQQYPPQ